MARRTLPRPEALRPRTIVGVHLAQHRAERGGRCTCGHDEVEHRGRCGGKDSYEVRCTCPSFELDRDRDDDDGPDDEDEG